MADKQTDPPENEPGETQEPDQEAFWAKFKDTVGEVVDARLAERDKQRAKDGSRRRTERRTTVPGVFADIMFGKEK
jgi:hypothetical protein